jgi:hypothetical protein
MGQSPVNYAKATVVGLKKISMMSPFAAAASKATPHTKSPDAAALMRPDESGQTRAPFAMMPLALALVWPKMQTGTFARLHPRQPE